jgi:hypothetical protein
MTRERDGITDEPNRTDGPPRPAPGPEGPNPFQRRSGMDVTFGDTRLGVVLAFAVLCPPVAAALGIIALFSCREEGAARKAMWMTLVAGPLAAGFAYLMMTRP